MKKGWSEVALGEVLELDIDAVPVDPTESYPFAGVYGFGRGLFVRDSVKGSDTTYARFHRLHEGQLVMSQPKGWEGAITVVPKEFEGRYLSSVFPTFRPLTSRLSPDFLNAITKCKWLWDALFEKSSGIGARRNSVCPEHLLSVKIRLPPIAEQQRIAAHLDAIESRLNRVQKLREAEQKQKQAFIASLAHRWDLQSEKKLSQSWTECLLGDVLSLSGDAVEVDTTMSYPNLGIYSYARGTFTKPPIEGSTTSAPQLYRVRTGQFIYSRLFAFEGAYALVQPSQDGFYVSNEFPAFDCDQDRILPEFLFAYFKSPALWTQLAEQSSGLGSRRQRIHPEVILNHRMYLPPLDYQKQVKGTLSKLTSCASETCAKELNALFPSILDVIFKTTKHPSLMT